MKWFANNGLFHIYDDATRAICKLELLEMPSLIDPPPDDPMPPNPCRTCLKLWAMDQIEEESIGHAKARGYIPADL